MIPRVIVQFSHPHSPLIKGEILTKCGDVYLDKLGSHGITADNVKRYTDLFRPLQWWEFRELEDMPEYIRINYCSGDEVSKVIEYRCLSNMNYAFYASNGVRDLVDLDFCTPASKQDYDNYIKSQND